MPKIRSTIFTLFILLCTIPCSFAQLKVLSAGNPALQWKTTQIQLIDQQLKDPAVKGPLRLELEAQKSWLTQWNSGSLSDQPWMKQAENVQLFSEPTIDPDKRATALRERLLGKNAKPTEKDTNDLQTALSKFPTDLGLRQLYLHWIDQRQYRDEYASAIVESATTLAGMLAEQKKQDEPKRQARAFCYYRAARALIHMESESAQAKNPIKDLQKHESQLFGIYKQIEELVGPNRPEFILLEVRMLRRDNWYGQALVLLEESAELIERQWYLNHRRDLLKDLGWNQPAAEAEKIATAYKVQPEPEIRAARRPNPEE